MEIFVIAKGLVAVLVSFRKKLRLLILLLFLAWMLNLGRQAQSFLILLRGDDMEKNIWEFLGRRWSYTAFPDLDEHLWRLRCFPS